MTQKSWSEPRTIAAVLLLAIIVSSSLSAAIVYYAARPVQAPYSTTYAHSQLPVSILISIDRTYTYMRNGTTDQVVWQSTNAAAVINDAIGNLTSGGRIFIKAGNYTFTTAFITVNGSPSAIGSVSVSNVELYGEGNSTILMAGTNLNAMVIGLQNVNGWYIHDLQINGNRARQSASGGSTSNLLAGVVSYNGQNIVIERCYVHDDKTFGILDYGDAASRIVDNYVVNNNANGIQIDTGSGYLIQGNVVDGASDVGISISGDSGTSTILTNVLCSDNLVENINLGVSPFSINTGIGIMIGDNGAANRVTVIGNIVSTTAGAAIESYPSGGTSDRDVVIESNLMYRVPIGVYIGPTIGASIEGNIIHNVHSNTSGTGVIYIESTASIVSIKGNTIENQTTTNGIGIFNNANGTIIAGNIINGTAFTGIHINANDSIISSNELIDPDMQAGSYRAGGIYIEGGSSYNLVSSNTFLLYNSNNYEIQLYGTPSYNTIIANTFLDGNFGSVDIGAGCRGNVISGNSLLGCSSCGIYDLGTGTLVLNNPGYNPRGLRITTPSFPSSGVSVTNTFPYPVRIYFSASGAVTAYSITDPLGSTSEFSTSITPGLEIHLDPGAQIQFTYTVAPVWKWYGT